MNTMKSILFGVLAVCFVCVCTASFGEIIRDSVDVAPLVNETRYQHWPRAAWSEGAGCWLVVWREGDLNEQETDIWCARISADGIPIDPEGIRITSAHDVQDRPVVTSDGNDFLVAWQDLRSGTNWDVYAARVSSAGVVLDPDGFLVAGGAHNQCMPTIVWSGSNYYAAWQAWTSDGLAPGLGGYGVCGARVSANGSVMDAVGIILAGATALQPTLAFHDDVGLVVILFGSTIPPIGSQAPFRNSPGFLKIDSVTGLPIGEVAYLSEGLLAPSVNIVPCVALMEDGTSLITRNAGKGGMKLLRFDGAGQKIGEEHWFRRDLRNQCIVTIASIACDGERVLMTYDFPTDKECIETAPMRMNVWGWTVSLDGTILEGEQSGFLIAGGDKDCMQGIASAGSDGRFLVVYSEARAPQNTKVLAKILKPGTDPEPPVCAITSPLVGATYVAPANITIDVTAEDLDGDVKKVEFYSDATKIGDDTSSPYSCTWTNAAIGDYALTVKVTDNDNGITMSAPVAITVEARINILPSCSIISPSNGVVYPVGANVTINALAADSDGSLSKVEFYSGTAKLNDDWNSPYSYTWNNAVSGCHLLTVKAIDNDNDVTTSSVVRIMVDYLGGNAPIAHWRLDEIDGLMTVDATGNGHDGLLRLGMSWTNGVISGAAAFSADNHYIKISPPVNVSIEHTVSGWFTAPLTGYDAYLNMLTDASGNSFICAKGLELGIRSVAEGGFKGCGFNMNTLSVGWHHVVAVGSGTETTLYIDGVEVGRSSGNVTTEVIYIGNDSGGNTFSDALDDLRVYDRALSPAEIAVLASDNVDPDTDGDGTPDSEDTDDDGDGMPDIWETANGFNSLDATDAGLDPDGDGFSNLEEYICDTDPGVQGSRLNVQGCTLNGTGYSVEFDSVIGRLYGVEYRDDLLDGAWQALTNDVPGTGGVINVNDPDVSGRRFYRIRVRLDE